MLSINFSSAGLWRNVILAVGLGVIAVPEVQRMLYPAIPKITLPAKTPSGMFLESSFMVRLGAHEGDAMPVQIGAWRQGGIGSFGLADAERVVRDVLRARRAAVVQVRERTMNDFPSLPGDHARLALVLSEDMVEVRLTIHCPPQGAERVGDVALGYDKLSRVAGTTGESLADELHYSLSRVAGERCVSADDWYIPDRATAVRFTDDEVMVRLGDPIPVRDVQVSVTSPQPKDSLFLFPSLRVADTTIARITALGIEGQRTGITVLEARQGTMMKGVRGEGKVVARVRLVVRE